MLFARVLTAVLCAASLAAALPAPEVVARQDDGTDADDTSTDTSSSAGTSSASGIISSLFSRCPPITPSLPCLFPTVRKEWRTLTNTQKKNFLNAVKCLGNKPHSSSMYGTGTTPDIPPINPDTSFYDDLVYIHIDLNHRIHATGHFFPWHRLFLAQFEKALRNKCGYSDPLPYWDWTKDTANFEEATFWDPDPNHGVGTWGTSTNDYQIFDGALGTETSSPFYINYPSHHAIRRQYTLNPYYTFPYPYLITDPGLNANETFTQAVVDSSVLHFTGDFKGFQKNFQDYQGPHAGVHLIVGADLTGLCPANAPPGCIPGETWSPNDPLFFLHHARVDKAWSDWQNRSPSNKCAFTGGTVQMLDSLADYTEYPLGAPPNLNLNSVMMDDGILPANIHIQDVMDTTGGYLCYIYE